RCILTHEYIHIRRFDTLKRLIFGAVLCIHWFDPLVWVMFMFASRDIELACDEAATAELGDDKRAAYLHVLITLEETKTRMAFPLVSHFGKHAVHERMSAVMKKKKYTLPVFIATMALVLAGCAAAAIGVSEETSDTMEVYFDTEQGGFHILPDLAPGDICTLLPQSFIGEGAEISYRSSDENVAIVDNKGNITAISPGEATIYITTSETDGPTLEHTAKIRVTDAEASIYIGSDEEVIEKIIEILEAEGYKDYRTEEHNLYVPEDQYVHIKALLLMHGLIEHHEYEAEYPSDYAREDRDVAYIHYLQAHMEEVIEEYDGVKEASVILAFSNDNEPAVFVLFVLDNGKKLTT
ncbi:MAG: Ig-like domain-containing protein, partial [Firmicutes bacterium]|nr:Ig-like domain-containing protein [Bacillota bacterium]